MRTAGGLKQLARLQGIDPYEAKVRELAAMLERCGDAAAGGDGGDGGGGGSAEGGGGGAAAVEVSVVREEQMRTHGGAATEGTAGCKNALILGRKVDGLLPPRLRSLAVAVAVAVAVAPLDSSCEQAST